MPQMKEQEKTTEKNLNEMKISDLPNKEFKEMIIRILNKFESIIEELSTATKRKYSRELMRNDKYYRRN